MVDVTIDEFSFVDELPKREVSKIKSALDMVNELSSITKEKGALIPVKLAGALLGVTKQTVHQFTRNGRLERIECQGHVFITENSLVDLAKSERKAGRPFKTPQTASECFAVASKVYRGK